jgi:diaminopimelate epimerase
LPKGQERTFFVASIPFAKVEGLGNDFLVVDLRPGRPGADVAPSPADPDVARVLCDRHFGIGADGILAILPGGSGDARMRVINADGSEAEMCGNGLRCVAKLLYEKDPAMRRPVLRIDTGAGLLACAVDAVDGQVRSVSVEMGQPRLRRGEIPMTGPAGERALRVPLLVDDRTFAFTAVSMGNPHAVIFVEDPELELRSLAETYGPLIERDPTFPRRTNVEFARLRSGPGGPEIDLVVWERGCGITLACGTGACATAAAACLEGRIAPNSPIPVNLPGGPLTITVRSGADPAETPFSGVSMRGPAEVVFEAELDPAPIVARASRRQPLTPTHRTQ